MHKRKISRAALFAAALTLVVTMTVAGTASARFGGEDAKGDVGGRSAQASYIVRLSENPAVAYEGGVPGLNATAPAKGNKLNRDDADVVKYVGYLKGKHDEMAAKVGGDKLVDYGYAYNGFAAKLNPDQVAKLQADPDVISVEQTQEVTMDTATTPTFLGLTDATNGLWTKGIKGEGIIIGILDTGVWPESKSFSDRDANGKLVYQPNPGRWHGRKCNPGEDWNASMCNQKLIGAQYYCQVRGCDGVLPHEFISPRDYNGHGTHTASTAGGNEGVPTTGAAAVFGTVNGIAPRARVAAYKIGWDNGAGSAGANTGDVVAAIDDAVGDGVDVINYSFSGTLTNYLDAVEVAYLFAARDGVFVATSAGNSGPTSSTVAHISPWLASVAAGTHNRNGTSTITLGNGATYTGASLTNGASGNVVLATASGLPGADPNLLRQCFSAGASSAGAQLDPAKVAGKIVVCERGGAAPLNARVDKSVAVREAGGVGVILYNVAAGASLNADLHSLPTVHVNNVDGAAIVAYVNGAGASATASFPNATLVLNAPAPDVAGFSSRGPSRAGGGDILKPDFMAPGQDILAAVAPPGNGGKDFDIYSGTSMSSPHVAGIGALLSQAHPSWSPAAMRSAIATTADALSRAGLNLPFNTGSGHVRPNLATDPGLVYDAGYTDYLSFLQGQNCQCLPASFPSIDASDLNQPSVAIGDLAGSQTVTRKVTNVGSAGTYNVNVEAPSGFTVAVSPTSLTLGSGQSASYTALITRTTGPIGTYRFGALTWSDGTHSVRSPIIVRPVSIAAPASLVGSGASGSSSFTVKTGYAGTLNSSVRGLIPATTTAGHVNDDPANSFSPTGQGITTHPLTIPAGTTYARVSLFDEFTDGNDDLDLYVANSAGTIVGASGGGTAAEEVNLVNPAAGSYTIYVHGWETDGPDANYTLFTWVLGSTGAGNATIAPASAAAGVGTPVSMTFTWSGLAAGTKYLGSIAYSDGTSTIGTTIVRIDVA